MWKSLTLRGELYYAHTQTTLGWGTFWKLLYISGWFREGKTGWRHVMIGQHQLLLDVWCGCLFRLSIHVKIEVLGVYKKKNGTGWWLNQPIIGFIFPKVRDEHTRYGWNQHLGKPPDLRFCGGIFPSQTPSPAAFCKAFWQAPLSVCHEFKFPGDEVEASPLGFRTHRVCGECPV